MSCDDMRVEQGTNLVHHIDERHKDLSLTSSSSTKMAATAVTNSESARETDFITFLQKKLTNNENVSFITSFAAFVHEKKDEFCIDLDDAYRWLGYARKDKALELLHKIGTKENVDYVSPETGEIKIKGRRPDKYLLKPAAFKKMLLAARTQEAAEAAGYFIKIEEAVFEFSQKGGTFGSIHETIKDNTERRIPHRNLPLEKFTQIYDPEKRPIVSAGYHDKMQDPQVYIGIVKNMRFIAGSVPDGASVLSFGYTGSADNRLRDHQSKNGDYIYIDHLPCAASYELEQEIRRYLIVMGRLLVGRRLNDSKDYEMFWVLNQADYIELISRFWEKRQQMICKEHGRSVDVALAKETSLQSMETTKQSMERTKQVIAQADSDARKAEAEARKADAEARKAEFQFRIMEIELQKTSIEMQKAQATKPLPSLHDSDIQSDKSEISRQNSINNEIDILEEDDRTKSEVSIDENISVPSGDIKEETQSDSFSGTIATASSFESTPLSFAATGNDTAATIPIDLFGEYTREKKIKKPAVAQVAKTRQRTTPVTEVDPLSIDKQETIDTFIANCCEMGTDEKPIRDIVTQHFFEPQTSLHSVYCTYTVHHRIPAKSAVKYTDFVRGLAARGVVQEFRTYPVKRTTKNGKLNRPLMSFVGIRLRSRPPTDLERDVTAFVGGFTEIIDTGVDVPVTTISMLFKSFKTHFPGWSAYYVNQCLLSSGYRIRFHPSKGERAWINVRLIDEDV